MLNRNLLGILGCALLVGVTPAMAQGGAYRSAGGDSEVRFRIGTFEPDAASQYWDDVFFDFTGSPSSFEDTVVGVDYIHWMGPHLGLLVSGSGYSTEANQAYRDFEDQSGRDIRHRTTFEVASATLGLIYGFGSRQAAIRPYVGAGGGFYNWRLEESGDFIDFGGQDAVIFTDTFSSEATAFGSFVLAGIDIPLGSSWSLFAEGRWDSAEDDLADDFEGLGKIDLGGRQISAGLSWRF
jgi:outer membrane protein W